MTETSAIRFTLERHGFAEQSSGGRRVAWIKELQNGHQLLITAGDNNGYGEINLPSWDLSETTPDGQAARQVTFGLTLDQIVDVARDWEQKPFVSTSECLRDVDPAVIHLLAGFHDRDRAVGDLGRFVGIIDGGLTSPSIVWEDATIITRIEALTKWLEDEAQVHVEL